MGSGGAFHVSPKTHINLGTDTSVNMPVTIQIFAIVQTGWLGLVVIIIKPWGMPPSLYAAISRVPVVSWCSCMGKPHGFVCLIAWLRLLISCPWRYLKLTYITSLNILRPGKGTSFADSIVKCVIMIKVFHDDVIKWKHIPRYWPFVRGIHRPPVNFPQKGQWRGVFFNLRLNKGLCKQSWSW